MYKKLSTQQQVALLKQGDIVKRYPEFGPPRDMFDENDKLQIGIYRIITINLSNQMVGLVATDDSVLMYPAFVPEGSLYIRTNELLEERKWWVDRSN